MSDTKGVQQAVLGGVGGTRVEPLASSSRDKGLLQRLAVEVLDYIYLDDPDSDPDDIRKAAPCAVPYESETGPVLMLYFEDAQIEATEQKSFYSEEGKKVEVTNVEHFIVGTFWNPLNEIHDAWMLLEAMSAKGQTILLESAVFGVPASVAARTISMTVLAAIDEKDKTLV